MWNNSRVLMLFLYVACRFHHCCLAFDEKKVTEMLENSFDCFRSTPAMAVALVKDGQTLYSRGFGYTDLDNKTKVTEDTLFGIASISKSFAAALLVKQLYTKTNMTIDTKVREYLGDDFVLADDVRTREATFLDMLSHKMAIPSNNRIRLDTTLTRDTLLSRLRLLPSNKQFRVDFVYSNLFYGLIGRMSEMLGGHAQNNKRWEDLITEHFFEPLGMTNATFATRVDFDREDLATAYTAIDGTDIMTPISHFLSRRWADLCASGSILSSVKEMTNWLNFHLSGGKNKAGQQVMDENLVEELHKPRIKASSSKYLGIERPLFPITIIETAYAMGLKTGHYRGFPLLAHTGTTYGYQAYMVMLPTENIGVIVVTTGKDYRYRHRAAVAQYLLDNALGVEPYLNASTMCTYPQPWITESMTPTYRPSRSNQSFAFTIEEYEGVYSETSYGNLEIYYNSSLQSLMMHYGWGDWEMMMYPTSSGTERFYGKAIEPNFPPDLKPFYFIEHPEKAGTIVGMKGTGLESRIPPIFCKSEHIDVCGEIRKNAYPEHEKQESCPPASSAIPMLYSMMTFNVLVLFTFLVNLVIKY